MPEILRTVLLIVTSKSVSIVHGCTGSGAV